MQRRGYILAPADTPTVDAPTLLNLYQQVTLLYATLLREVLQWAEEAHGGKNVLVADWNIHTAPQDPMDLANSLAGLVDHMLEYTRFLYNSHSRYTCEAAEVAWLPPQSLQEKYRRLALLYAGMLTEFVSLEARERRETIGALALLEGIVRMVEPAVQAYSLAGLVDFILEYARLPQPERYRARMHDIWRIGRHADPPPHPSAREQLDWMDTWLTENLGEA